MTIMIDGKPLHQLTPVEIVDAVTRDRDRVLYDLGPRGDFFRNVALLEGFGDASTASTAKLAERYHAQAYGDYSIEFDALRIAEALLFGIRHGLVSVSAKGGGGSSCASGSSRSSARARKSGPFASVES